MLNVAKLFKDENKNVIGKLSYQELNQNFDSSIFRGFGINLKFFFRSFVFLIFP